MTTTVHKHERKIYPDGTFVAEYWAVTLKYGEYWQPARLIRKKLIARATSRVSIGRAGSNLYRQLKRRGLAGPLGAA